MSTTVLNTLNAYALVLQAICVWKESRGEDSESQRAVIWSQINRAGRAAWWNHNTAFDLAAVVTFPEQYSGMTHLGDPNTVKFPIFGNDPVFMKILLLCLTPGDDPTEHATHYYDISIDEPGWAKEMEFTVQVGKFRFYKIPD